MDSMLPIVTAVTTAVVSGVMMLLLQLALIPVLERRKVIEQELWKTKKESFLRALELIDRVLVCLPWSGPAVPADYEPSMDDFPTALELNRQLHELVLLSRNPEIPQTFTAFI